MSSLKDQVIEALCSKPNQKADAIARSLGVDRTQINKLLYGPLKGQVSQDRAYRWSLVNSSPPLAKGDENQDTGIASTDLARLCRYYLACLTALPATAQAVPSSAQRPSSDERDAMNRWLSPALVARSTAFGETGC